ncbi:MAG: hypothetical protein HYS13_01585 [Planctomycetia bacterium]|nr:hypothetical protein [Planctomycetia bacterium]
MLKAVDSTTNLVRAVVALVVVGILGAGGWLGYDAWHDHKYALQERDAKLAELTRDLDGMKIDLAKKQKEIERLGVENQQLKVEVERLATANRLLKVDRRVARLEVLDQFTSDDGKLMSKILFVETDDDKRQLTRPQEFLIEGDAVYIDAWVAKFRDEYVEKGVPLKDASLYLFRTIYGKNQAPADGFPLDDAGKQPLGYRYGRDPSPLEQEIWANFWTYANDREKAESIGLRAPHGQANYVEKIKKGMVYRVQARASDGLTIVAEDKPAKPAL